jgi:diadenosine tetraphosphate (Ap4A) HIT family hydrolase
MRAVFAAEQALREVIAPAKINLASLGNRVPHLHWHVIARDAEDRYFPDSVWSAPGRNRSRRGGRPIADVQVRAIGARLRALLGGGAGARGKRQR